MIAHRCEAHPGGPGTRCPNVADRHVLAFGERPFWACRDCYAVWREAKERARRETEGLALAWPDDPPKIP